MSDLTSPTTTEPAESGTYGVPISLQKLTKRYSGTKKPAVDAIDLEIPAGEIVVLVGPSGCGKTTTMRMINRMITPSSGKVEIDGEDVKSLNDTTLRRQIGYVIQQVGLIPHLTIASNVALVPKLLKWDKQRIHDRVDKMLAVVGLDPEEYRDRYPRQLSGGQQQRVGVARALAADPPIMLMDEPFGAVDPITRGHLQDEFLDLQRRLQKTIVFVTHDFDEALKLGDRIAVLAEGSRIVQYDTPERILAAPADDFVAGFIGEGAALKRLHFEEVATLEYQHEDGCEVSVDAHDSLHQALDVMVGRGLDHVAVAEDGNEVGSISVGSILERVTEDESAARSGPSSDDGAVGAHASGPDGTRPEEDVREVGR